ncbi:MAG: hypothetical protein K2I63_02190 [Helicobacter sp.]|nr:hypothetical protein [Helicobacter sp.]
MYKNKIQELQEEIQELSIQLSDMLCVALTLAGVKENHIEEALDAYIETLDEQNTEYGVKEILNHIGKLKQNNPSLFEN